MAEPTRKSMSVEDFITHVMGKNRVETIRAGLCMTCDNKAESFRDALSEKEYTISGMCQDCQDSVFGKGD